jgi:hypothetical protein
MNKKKNAIYSRYNISDTGDVYLYKFTVEGDMINREYIGNPIKENNNLSDMFEMYREDKSIDMEEEYR